MIRKLEGNFGAALSWSLIGNATTGVKRATDGVYELTIGPRGGRFAWYLHHKSKELLATGVSPTEKAAKHDAVTAMLEDEIVDA